MTEDDLIVRLNERVALGLRTGDTVPPPIPASRDLQNYILRDFVESLLPMENVLREALYSPRAFEQALLGDFSPFRLAEQIGQAFRSGRRSAIATCFQFVELLRIVASLSLPQLAEDKLQLMEEQRKKAIESIVALAHALTECDDFRGVLADKSSDYRHPKLRVVVEEIVRRCDVHHLSKQIAKSLRNSDYVVAPSRLCDIERKGATPNLYRLHAPSLAYDCKLEQLLKFYGIAKDHLVAGVVARSEYRCLKRLGYNKVRTIFTESRPFSTASATPPSSASPVAASPTVPSVPLRFCAVRLRTCDAEDELLFSRLHVHARDHGYSGWIMRIGPR